MRVQAAAALPTARNEAERTAVLAAQDRAFLPPAELAHLFIGERLAPSHEPEARARWQELRARLRAGAGTEQGRTLVLLTLALAESWFERGELLAQRALIDSVFDVVSDPRLQQVLRAQLARTALRADDVAGAEAWLTTCDPKSEDLLADTAYRFAAAYLETARGRLAEVVRALGTGDLPLSHAYAPECAVLCANAWEKSGQSVIAVDVLIAAKREVGPLGRRRTKRFVSAHSQWQLCPRSEPEAERRMAQLEPASLESGAMGGLTLTLMGTYGLVWAASAVLLPPLLGPLGVEMTVSGVGFSILLGGILAIFLPIGLGGAARARRRAKLRASGRAYGAHVLAAKTAPTDPGAGRVTVELSLLITPDDGPAYPSEVRTNIQREMLENFQPGKLLIARVHSTNLHEYALEVV